MADRLICLRADRWEPDPDDLTGYCDDCGDTVLLPTEGLAGMLPVCPGCAVHLPEEQLRMAASHALRLKAYVDECREREAEEEEETETTPRRACTPPAPRR